MRKKSEADQQISQALFVGIFCHLFFLETNIISLVQEQAFPMFGTNSIQGVAEETKRRGKDILQLTKKLRRIKHGRKHKVKESSTSCLQLFEK